jgi:hypothetical protein
MPQALHSVAQGSFLLQQHSLLLSCCWHCRGGETQLAAAQALQPSPTSSNRLWHSHWRMKQQYT